MIVRGSRLVVLTGYSVHDHSCVTVTSRNFVHNSYSIINFVSSHAHMRIIYHVSILRGWSISSIVIIFVVGSDRRMSSHYRTIIIVGKLVGSRGDVIHTHHSFSSHLSHHRAVSRIIATTVRSIVWRLCILLHPSYSFLSHCAGCQTSCSQPNTFNKAVGQSQTRQRMMTMSTFWKLEACHHDQALYSMKLLGSTVLVVRHCPYAFLMQFGHQFLALVGSVVVLPFINLCSKRRRRTVSTLGRCSLVAVIATILDITSFNVQCRPSIHSQGFGFHLTIMAT